jgi:uncharacterized protein (DUF1330 family)
MTGTPLGYLVADITVTDPVRYRDYMVAAGASVAAYGGQYIVRGGTTETVEGEPPTRAVLIEFPSFQAAHDWYHSADYQAAAAIRRECATARMFLVEGAPAI